MHKSNYRWSWWWWWLLRAGVLLLLLLVVVVVVVLVVVLVLVLVVLVLVLVVVFFVVRGRPSVLEQHRDLNVAVSLMASWKAEGSVGSVGCSD